MLNYRTTLLRQGLSPAELLMGSRLKSIIPVITSKRQPQKLNLKKFKLFDKHEKTHQKNYFDRRHSTQILPELPKNNHVWVKSPTTHEPFVMQKFNCQHKKGDNRSYLVQTPSGRHCQAETKPLAPDTEKLTPNQRGNTFPAGDFSVAKLCRPITPITPRGT